jgi:hypothetical protein
MKRAFFGIKICMRCGNRTMAELMIDKLCPKCIEKISNAAQQAPAQV